MSAAESQRLPAPAGLLIDRSRRIGFNFEGRRYEGFAGDTIASALIANGHWLLARSFKYRRPRSVLTMAGQDGNTLVQIGAEPNALADRHPIAEGLMVHGQNYDGSLEHDRGAWIEMFGRFMPVGFYYKAFFKPKGSWKYWEKFIRARAGLGKVDLHAHHDYFDKEYLFADVVVIGGGPAGMAAAIEAAKAGGEVILIDENPQLGGSLLYARFDQEGARAAAVTRELTAAVAAAKNIRVMTDTTCTGWFADNWLALISGSRLYKVRAKAVVQAAGSIEQPAVFRNNDVPGVMLGSAAQRLIRFYGIRPGKRAMVMASNADGYAVALDLADAGVEVGGVVDINPQPPQSPLVEAVLRRGISIMPGHAITEALHSLGKKHVVGAHIERMTGEGTTDGKAARYECDLICMSVGYTPAAQTLYHAGAKFRYDHASNMYRLEALPAHAFAAGSANGAYDLDAVLAEGRHAGWAAAKDSGGNAGTEPPKPARDQGANGQTHPWPVFPHPKGKDFVDFDEDLTSKDLKNGIADGYDNPELLKRYSTIGMGPSQGRHSAVANVRFVARQTGRDLAAMAVTTQRPPYRPEKFGHLAGRIFDPARRTAMHHRHIEAGARMMVAGTWYRPAYYGTKDQRDQSIREEVLAVRNNVGLIDVSTLGGLDVRGPDAAEFLNRMYTFTYTKLEIGRSRYVLMTDQSGAVVDDGVACRFQDEHFYVTATTGGVDAVYRTMLFWNAQWRLNVDIANVTAAYAGVNIAGPRAREVLEKVCQGTDLSPTAFPYLGVREAVVAGIPARLLRVGFVGELGYEIHVPASQGEALWDALMEAGRDAGIRPFGVEAQRCLRLEKGHIIIGQDTDGLTTPFEADMPWAVAKKKPFYVGGRSVAIQNARPLSRKLVGFEITDKSVPVPEECHLVVRGGQLTGRVTSAVMSPTVDRIIGLAYVAPDQSEPGQTFDIRIDGGRMIQGTVVRLPHYDPDGKRQEM
ncbi:MAG: glycine cleavage T C-terminal barrel domain-containing protein [Rhodospirillaceae bacterium]|nr:glycine cleavage T C-terminal barrel domain-containing protein [Rhodospirillaceae bacterium]